MVKDKAFYKSLMLIALPVAFQGLISMSVNLLDNIMVGSLGDVPFSSVALGNQLSTLMNFFIRGVTGGSAVMISQYWGKKDLPRIRQLFGTVSRFVLVSVLLITALVFAFPAGAMRIFTNDLQLIEAGKEYLRIVCLSYVLMALSDTMIAMLRWVEVVKLGLVVSGVSFFANLFFNYVLIFGKLGLPAMGTRGAALATVIARGVELAIVLVYVFCVDKRLQLKIGDMFRGNKQMFLDFVRYGVPIIVSDIQWGIIGAGKAMMIGRLGTTMVSANSIADVVMSLSMIFTSGLASGACQVIGKTVGAKQYDKTRQYSGTIQILFVLIGVLVCIFLLCIRNIPPQFYNVSEETKRQAVLFITVGAFTLIGTCYHMACFTGINRGAGDGKFVMKVDMLCGWLVVLPLTYLTGFVWELPLVYVFLATRIDQCFKWLIALIRLRGNKWIQNVTRD